jgi:superfamily II DNA/RNA helicase
VSHNERKCEKLTSCINYLFHSSKQILNLKGLRSLSIDGSMSFDKRDKIVLDFLSSKTIMILIFSSVGAAGLNLSRADTVIMFVSIRVYLRRL